ncbi:glycosyltransferase family 4 protein [Algoriphagus sp. NBT04N3]|uniref:glycosyltransferase family 4 protein n=1 Tax=Algoriphagus sp. NBT04N3 TaxID=2705473 RepID=UPI001C62F6E3|nr:glycosyltransferase family 4 protein [Algoriphagus sp. NBT04N3]QYH37974.1 glycosyltransferase family 4 protein [Algoriphagus sp. NBT04N3]
MNILLIHQYFLEEDDPGGSRFNEMAANWISDGHQVTVVAGMVHYNGTKKRKDYKGKFFRRKMQGGIKVVRTHVSESYNSSFIGRLWGYFSFTFSSTYAGLFLCKEKYDFILVTSPPLFIGISGYLISRFKRIPFIFEVRDLWPESAIDTKVLTNKYLIKLAYSLEGFIYKKAHLINVLTPAFRKKLIEEKNVNPEKIIFIPNGADFRISDQLLNTFNAGEFRNKMGWEEKFIITYVGAHGVANHLEQIFDVAELLRDSPVLFVMIGMGMRKPFLLEEKQNRKIENVIFLDPVPKKEIFQYILASDMGASILKKADTFKTIYSNKTFDYMSCKKPVLMAIDGVSKDLVEDAKAGSYVEPENAAHYHEVISSYINNPKRSESEGENGYSFVKEHFDREILSSKYLQLIKEKVLEKQ